MKSPSIIFLCLIVLPQIWNFPIPGNDWSDGHQKMFQELFKFGTEEEKWIVSSVPDVIAKRFPNFEIQDLAVLHPDILWRISDQTFQNVSRFSGAVLADLISTKGPGDLSILRKASSVLQGLPDSVHLEFLDKMDSKMNSIQWKTLSLGAASWWPNYSSMIKALNKMTNVFNKVSFVTSLPCEVYRRCNGTTNGVCIDNSLFDDTFDDAMKEFLSDIFTSDAYQKELSIDKRQNYFRLWNEILLTNSNISKLEEIPGKILSNFIPELLPSQRLMAWCQLHSIDGCGKFLYKEVPLLFYLRGSSMTQSADTDLVMTRFTNVTDLVVTLAPHLWQQLGEDIERGLAANGTMNTTNHLLVSTFTEKICLMSMKELAKLPSKIFSFDLLQNLQCLSHGQKMVIVKNLFQEFGPILFLQKVPKEYYSSLLLEDFDDVMKAVFKDENQKHLEKLVKRNFLTTSQEYLLFDTFTSKLSNITEEREWQLWKTVLSYGNPDKILDNFFPSNLTDKVEWIVEQMKKEKLDTKLPTILASILISQKKGFVRAFLVDTLSDSYLAPKMISGLSCYHVNSDSIPQVSSLRMYDIYFGHFVDKMDRGILSSKDMAVLKCLFEKLNQDVAMSDKSYQQQLVRQFENTLKKRVVGQVENNVQWFSTKFHGPCSNTFLEADKLEEMYGLSKKWTSDHIEKMGESISSLSDSEFDQISSKELFAGLTNFIRARSKEIGAKTHKSLEFCYGPNYKADYQRLSKVYLKATEANLNSQSHSNGVLHSSTEAPTIDPSENMNKTSNIEQAVSNAEIKDIELSSPTDSFRGRRSIERCNFTSHQFTTELFSHISEIVWNKLDTSTDENRPQIGPLLMDMRHQRHLILAGILGLDSDLPVEHVSLAAKDMFTRNMVSPENKRRVLDAYSDLHMKAIRRLVIAGELKPKELQLDCQIDPVDLYLVFPPPVVDAYYKEVGYNLQKSRFSQQSQGQGVQIPSGISPCVADCLLPILLNGSDGSSSKTISESEFVKGAEAVERIYLEVLDLITHDPKDELSVPQLEKMMLEEQLVFVQRLRSVFQIDQVVPDVQVMMNAGLQVAKDPFLKQVLLQEHLRLHYSILKRAVQLMQISPLFLFKNQTTTLPSNVLFDLFPQYSKVRSRADVPLEETLENFDSSLAPIKTMKNRVQNFSLIYEQSIFVTKSAVPEEGDKETLKMLDLIGQSPEEENNDLREFLVQENINTVLGDPIINLFCSYRLISRDKQSVEVCSTDLFDKGSEMFAKLIDAPDFEHKWFSDWTNSNFLKFDFDKSHLDPFVDQQMIQAVFLSTVKYIHRNKTEVNLREKLDFEGLGRLIYPGQQQSEPKKFGALKQMLDISKELIEQLGIIPSNLADQLPMDNPIMMFLFDYHIKNLIGQNPGLHSLLCDYHLISLGCHTNEALIHLKFSDTLDKKEGLKIKFVYDSILSLLEHDSAKFNESLKNRMKIIENNLPLMMCQLIGQTFGLSDFYPCPKFGIHLLQNSVNQTQLDEIETQMSSLLLKVVKMSIKLMSLDPSDVDLQRHTSDVVVKQIFEDYFAERNEKIHQEILTVNPLYVRAKGLLMKLSNDRQLTENQVRQAKMLIEEINIDSKNLFKSLFGVDKVDNLLSNDLIQNIKVSATFTDEVKEKLFRHTLSQKIFVVSKLVHILDLFAEDFDSEDLKKLSPTVAQGIFGIASFSEDVVTKEEDQAPKIELRSLHLEHRPSNGLEAKTVQQKKIEDDFEDEYLNRILHLKSYEDEVYRRNVDNPVDSRATLQHMVMVAFHLYHKAITIAGYKRDSNLLDQVQVEELNSLLSSQLENIYNKLQTFLGGPELTINVQQDQQLAFVLLSDAMTNNQTNQLDMEILKHHLKVTKQIIILLELIPADFDLNQNFPLPEGISKYLFDSTSHIAGRTNDYLHAVNAIYLEMRRILSMTAQRGELSAKQTITAKKIIYELNKQSVQAMVNILRINDTTMTPEELIEVIRLKRNESTLEDGAEQKIKEIVYFKKLTAIKDLVELLKVDSSQVVIPPNTPKDLINLIFSNDSSQLDNIQKTSHNPFNSQWNPPDQPDSEPHPDDPGFQGGFFCMPCFHRAYEKWKVEQGITSPSLVRRNVLEPKDEMKKQSIGPSDQENNKKDDLILYETIKDLSKDFSFPNLNYMLAPIPPEKKMSSSDGQTSSTSFSQKIVNTEEGLQTGDIPNPRFYTGHILYFYNNVVKIAFDRRNSGLPKAQYDELMLVLNNQKQSVYQELPLVLDSGSYYTVERPYGILLQTLPSESSDAVANFIAKFHLDVIKKVVNILRLNPEEIDPNNSMPAFMKAYLFGPQFRLGLPPVEPERLRAVTALYEFLKKTLLMKNQLNQLTQEQVTEAKNIVEGLENKKKTMVFQILNITDNYDQDLKILVQQKVDQNVLTLSQSDKLEQIDFDLKYLATKEFAGLLAIDKGQVPDSENLDPAITQEIFAPTPRRFTMTQNWPPRKFGKSLASDDEFSFLDVPDISVDGLNYERVVSQINIIKDAEVKPKQAKTVSDVIEEISFDEIGGRDLSPIILPASLLLENDFFAKFSSPKALAFPGCRALRSTGLSDIILSPTSLEEVQPEVWRDCLDVFDLEGARQFWPQHFDKLEKLELLRRHNIPESVELPSREEKSFSFENVTLDIVDAFVASDHQDIEVCEFSHFLLQRYLQQRDEESNTVELESSTVGLGPATEQPGLNMRDVGKLSTFETLLLARLPCIALDDNDLFVKLLDRSSNPFLLAQVINTKRILMNTKALRNNLEVLVQRITPDIKFLSVQDVQALGLTFTGLAPSEIWELIDSEAILGITSEAVEAMTSKQLEVIPDAVLKNIPNGIERKSRLR